MGNVVQIKLEKLLPDLLPGDAQIVNEALAEMYDRGYSAAKEHLCQGCSYKSYYIQVAAQGDCNDCGARRNCPHVPRPGGIVRINCPLWRAKG